MWNPFRKMWILRPEFKARRLASSVVASRVSFISEAFFPQQFPHESFQEDEDVFRDAMRKRLKIHLVSGQEMRVTEWPSGIWATLAYLVPQKMKTVVEVRRWNICPHVELPSNDPSHIMYLGRNPLKTEQGEIDKDE